MKKIFGNQEDKEREAAADQVFSRTRRSLSDIVPGQKKNVVEFIEEEKAGVHGHKTKFESEMEADNNWQEKIFSWKKWIYTLVAAVIAFMGILLAVYILPQAEIKITLRKTPWQYGNTISALITGGDVSAQIFSQTKNNTLSFPASGKKYLETKSSGTITIYNAYSSDKQALVASTRFLSPDGKIFRLNKGITVPGATVTNGKIIPSSIDAAVTADKAGEDYNTGPVSRWVIPGFKGSPKYDAFYGASAGSMAGGSVGEKLFATDADIAKAKDVSQKTIQDSITSATAFMIPQDFTVLNASSTFRITTEKAYPEAGSDGRFTYFIEAKDDKVAVKGDDILNFVIKLAKAELGDNYKPGKDSKFKFSVQNLALKKDGKLNGAQILVNFSANFVQDIDLGAVKDQIAGKSEKDLRTLVLSNPAIESANVSLWPFWVMSVPARLEKISVTAE